MSEVKTDMVFCSPSRTISASTSATRSSTAISERSCCLRVTRAAARSEASARTTGGLSDTSTSLDDGSGDHGGTAAEAWRGAGV